MKQISNKAGGGAGEAKYEAKREQERIQKKVRVLIPKLKAAAENVLDHIDDLKSDLTAVIAACDDPKQLETKAAVNLGDFVLNAMIRDLDKIVYLIETWSGGTDA